MEILTKETHKPISLIDLFTKQKEFANLVKKTNAKERIGKLKKLERAILKYRSSIEVAVYKDFKKHPVATSFSEIYKELTEIRYNYKHLKSWMNSKKVATPLPLIGTRSKIVYEPKGTVLIISPWNYPFQLCINPLISAIAAGNTAIIKPSELTPNTSKVMKKLISEVFDPREVTVVEGGQEVSTELLKLPFDHIFFTGSSKVGKIVMEAAAKNLSSVTLELGGKSPLFIDKSADLKDAVEKIAWGKLLNNGQTCIAPDYILLHESIQDEFVKLLSGQINKMYNPEGKGIENSKDYCRIINQKHYLRLTGMLDNAIESGANIAYGGEVDAKSNYISPTLLTNVNLDSKVMHEEIFGPILPIIPYQNLEEAVALVNRKEKPLALYIFSKDKKFDRQVLENTTAGGTCINEVLLHIGHSELPFGGVNNSGIGKGHGFHGFTAFSNERAVLRQRVGFTGIKLMYPPFTPRSKQLLDFMMKWF